ncbi:DUF3080 domain-containing protein [Billgrantia pellis]|uniref:DUF3080 domain-containing protein n=1 Tax=Billgrantia pellis TaxID=2606936 RepID=A0A7V7KIS9_9GAMM|nr:DUF3080 family protein [Halomonas pellis]KAA0014104.1 DUF3080 domain-containing protein [Halomonas pellis]
MASWTFLEAETIRRLVLSLLLMLLMGCSDGGEGEASLVDYQRKLASALGRQAPERSPPGNIDAFPERNERLFEVPETRESILSVYALRECRITSLVAARNNQLGRVAPPSQRWIYELELWRRLHACGNSEVPASLSEPHRKRLERLLRSKTEQLPLVSWNSQFDSKEWIGSFSRASSPLAPGDTRALEAQLEAVTWLREATLNQFNPHWSPDSATLEAHLSTLRNRPFTAELLRALLLAEQRLSEANMLLNDALTNATACPVQSASGLTRELPELPAFLWLSRLEAVAERWLQAVDALFDSHIPPPDAVAAYRQRWLSLENPAAPLPALRRAREEHRRHWQVLRGRCE